MKFLSLFQGGMGKLASLSEVEDVRVAGKSQIFPAIVVYAVNFCVMNPFPKSFITYVVHLGQAQGMSTRNPWSLGLVVTTPRWASPSFDFNS